MLTAGAIKVCPAVYAMPNPIKIDAPFKTNSKLNFCLNPLNSEIKIRNAKYSNGTKYTKKPAIPNEKNKS